MAALSPEAEDLTRSNTTIDDLPVEMLTEVLLRVPTPAALICAAAASRRWRGVVATPEFTAGYRRRHCSPPFLGVYLQHHQVAGPPLFVKPNSIQCADDNTRIDPDVKHAALKASDIGGVRRYRDLRLHDAGDHAFIHGGIGVHAGCRLLDCHNSRLVLTRGDEGLEVRSPLARETVLLPFPPDVGRPDSLQACLLQGHDPASSSSFRVVCLQHRREGRRSNDLQPVGVRASEYDSSRKSWLDYPWETHQIVEMPQEAMHAGHLIFWTLRGRTTSSLLLDTRTMKFSVHDLPSESNFAIGEIEDDKCCLVEGYGCNPTLLRVWQLEENLEWKKDKEAPLEQVLGKHSGYYRVRAVANGIVLLWSMGKFPHFVVDLNTFCMKEEFGFNGMSVWPWPIQMPWPPVFSHPTTNAAGGLDQDGGPVSPYDARIGAGEPSPAPSLGGCFSADPVDDVRTASGELDAIEDLFGGTLAMDPLAAPAAEPLLCVRRSHSPSAFASCPQQGRKQSVSRESKGSSEVMGPGRRNLKRKPKYLEAIFALRTRRCIASKISDYAHIATSCSGEASAASTATVSTGECKLLLGGSSPTFKFTDVGKQPSIDVSTTGAPILSDPTAGESAEQRGKVAQDCSGGIMPSNKPQDLDIQDPTATSPTSAIAEQCFGKDKNYVPNDYLVKSIFVEGVPNSWDNSKMTEIFSKYGVIQRTVLSCDIQSAKRSDFAFVHYTTHEAAVLCLESFEKEGLTENGLKVNIKVSITKPDRKGKQKKEDKRISTQQKSKTKVAPAVEPEEPRLHVRSRSRSLNHDLLLQPPTLASCPLKRWEAARLRRQGNTTGRGRRPNMPNPKYLEGEWVV